MLAVMVEDLEACEARRLFKRLLLWRVVEEVWRAKLMKATQGGYFYGAKVLIHGANFLSFEGRGAIIRGTSAAKRYSYKVSHYGNSQGQYNHITQH